MARGIVVPADQGRPTPCATSPRWPRPRVGTGTQSGLRRTAARYRSLPWTKCGRSTGCSGSCAGTAQARWMPRAPARWIRRRQRHQDRLDAGEGDREHAPAAAPRGVPGEEERRREDARICCLLALDTSTELRRLFPHRNWAPRCARSMDATAISARLAIRRVRFRRRLHRAGQLLHAQRAVRSPQPKTDTHSDDGRPVQKGPTVPNVDLTTWTSSSQAPPPPTGSARSPGRPKSSPMTAAGVLLPRGPHPRPHSAVLAGAAAHPGRRGRHQRHLAQPAPRTGPHAPGHPRHPPPAASFSAPPPPPASSTSCAPMTCVNRRSSSTSPRPRTDRRHQPVVTRPITPACHSPRSTATLTRSRTYDLRKSGLGARPSPDGHRASRRGTGFCFSGHHGIPPA